MRISPRRADTCALAADQPQSLSVIRFGLTCDQIADYLRFSALGCYYRWQAQISQFGQAQAGPRDLQDLQGRLADAVTEMSLFPMDPAVAPLSGQRSIKSHLVSGPSCGFS
jgi:hypothetical protein